MRTLRLGRTDAQVSAISLGTWSYGGLNTVGGRSVGWGGHDPRAALDALIACHEAGINHWDTADVYGSGRSESLIGASWGLVPRDEVFLATKVGWDPGPHDGYYHPDQIRGQLEKSLRQLDTEVVDLYYLHHCDFGEDDGRLDGAIELLRRFRDEGKVRFIGLSDWDCSKIVRVIERVDPDVVQPYRNVAADTYASSGLKAWVEAHDLGVAFFSPIRHGLLLGEQDAPREFEEGDFRRNVDAFAKPETLAQVRGCADRLRERFPQRAEPVLGPLLEALLEDTPTGCVLLGQRSPEQVRAASAAEGPLSAEEAAWVRSLYAGVSV